MATVTHKHIYFVRHGESEANAKWIHQGPESPLSVTGKKQAAAIASRVVGLDITEIITSPFKRARQTASIIAGQSGCPVSVSEFFVERRRPSEILGLHYEDHHAASVSNLLSEHAEDPQWRHSDEETYFELIDRARHALDFLAVRDSETILVVTHGTFLRALAGVIISGLEFSPAMMRHYSRSMRTANTGITYCQLREDEVGERFYSIVSWNDQAHL